MDWFTEDRATAWLRVLAVVTAILAASWIALSSNGVDPTGKPLGTDFIAFWTAGRLTLEGGAAAAYDAALLGTAQQARFPGVDVGYSPFPYPPTFLLICLPLGALPYFPALAVWVGVTGLGYWRIVGAWAAGAFPSTLAALAFPAAFLNLAHGQTAFLTAVLFGAGALALPRRPFIAGLFFGLLTFKPHLGILIPVALLAARQWRAILGAVTSALTLAAAALLAFGAPAWAAFLKQSVMMGRILQTDLLDPGKIQSTFGALRLWDAPATIAYAGQAPVSLAALVVVAVVAWRRPRSRAIGPVLIAATLIATPYILDYDLTLMAIPMAWVLSEAVRTGFRRGEKAVLLAAYVLPLVSRVLAMKLLIPLAPAVLIALLAITVRRALSVDGAVASAPPPGSSPGSHSLKSAICAASARWKAGRASQRAR
jgi:hypothetical protein